MGHPDGAHTHGHGGDPVPVLVIGALILAAMVAPALIALLNALLIALAVAVGVLLAASAAFLVWRLRRHPALPVRLPAPHPVTAAPRRAVPQHVHLHLHGMSPEDVAAVIRTQHEEGQPWPPLSSS